jgi:hypothetical protein
MIQYALYSSASGGLLADYSSRAEQLTFASNNRGWAECACFVPMGLSEAFQLYDRAGCLHVQLADSASGVVFQGRLEDVAINGGGVTLTALGYARALSDAPYTAMWSMIDVTKFRPVRDTETAARKPELYQFDTNNRIQIALPQGAIYGNATDGGGMVYQIPHGSSRQIIGVMFDAVVDLPANWVFQLNQWAANYASVATTAINAGFGGTTQTNRLYTFAGCDYLEFVVYNNTGANYTVANAPNVWRVMITNVRLVTATTNMVNTTITANQAFAAGMTITVASTARMYAGQRLHIGHGTPGVGCSVTSVTDGTHFVTSVDPAFGTATIGDVVQGFVVYADEIVKDLVSVTNALNPAQLSGSAALIQSPSLDLLNESYEDMYPADILDRLVRLGDTQTPSRQWEWGVTANQLLYLRPQNSAGRTWYIDVSELDVRRMLDALWNSIYAVYKEPGGRTLRAAVTADSTSVARYAITRRRALNVASTSATQAGVQQAAALADGKDPKPRSGVTITQVFDASGNRWPLWQVQAGDTVIMRNLSPTLSSAIDRIRAFRLSRATYDFDRDTLALEPELPLPSLASMLALATAPNWVTAPWWIQVDQA